MAAVLIRATALGGYTGKTGETTIPRVPAGRYRVELRAAGLPRQSREVIVRENQTSILTFQVKILPISIYPGAMSPDLWDRPDGRMRPPTAQNRVSSSGAHSKSWISPCASPQDTVSSGSWLVFRGVKVRIPAIFRREEYKIAFQEAVFLDYETLDRSSMLSLYHGPFADRFLREDIGSRSRYGECTEMIGGKRARIVSYFPARTGRDPDREFAAAAIWRNVSPGVHLTLYGEAHDGRGLRELLAIFRTTQFQDSTTSIQ